MTTTQSHLDAVLDAVRRRAVASGVFGEVRAPRGALDCDAKDSAAPATYRLFVAPGRDGAERLWVALVTADRWLSQSIEQDLVHTGDKLEELMEEELADQGAAGAKSGRWEHFRDEDRLFTFRAPTPIDPAHPGAPEAAADTASKHLFACEAMFRRLGDMQADSTAVD